MFLSQRIYWAVSTCAICDGRQDDDIKIGIKSTAILFGCYDTRDYRDSAAWRHGVNGADRLI